MNSPVRTDAPPLIRRQVFLGNPDKASPQISPDGAWLGWLAPVDGVLNVWAAPAEKPAEARPVTRDTGRGVRMYSWTYSRARIVYLQDSDGDENWHIYTVDLESGEIRDLTPIEGVRAEVQQVSPQHPQHLLVGLNDRDPRFHDIHASTWLPGNAPWCSATSSFPGSSPTKGSTCGSASARPPTAVRVPEEDRGKRVGILLPSAWRTR